MDRRLDRLWALSRQDDARREDTRQDDTPKPRKPEKEREKPREEPGKPAVLVVHPAVSTGRLIRETLESFTTAEVDTSPDAVYGFELALKKRYKLFIFGLRTPVIEGPLLYELISKAYSFCHEGSRLAPAVIYINEPGARITNSEVIQDARVKGILSKPLSIEKLLETIGDILPRVEPIGHGPEENPAV